MLDTMIDKNEALRIAQTYAGKVYRDLSVYKVQVRLEDDKWYVDYEFIDADIDGGGPHYILSAETGEIIGFRYEQ